MQTTFSPEALCFKPATNLSAQAPSFKPVVALNPEARTFKPSTKSNSQAQPSKAAAPLNPEAAVFKPAPRLDPEASPYKPGTTLEPHAASAAKLIPEAPTFTPSFKFNAQAPSFIHVSKPIASARLFEPTGKLNPEKPTFKPSLRFDPEALCFQPAFALINETSCLGSTIKLDPEAPAFFPASQIDRFAAEEQVEDDEPTQPPEPIQEQGSLVYHNPDQDVHHINWLGEEVMAKSFTKPATSLAIILGAAKLLGGKICHLLERDLYKQIVLNQAFCWIDPVVFTGSRETLRLSGTVLEDAAIGQTNKFYSECGWWTGDHYGEVEDAPQWDPLDENSYYPNDVVVNGLLHDCDVYLPNDHWEAASVLQTGWDDAGKARYWEKISRTLGESPLRQVWNASDLDEYDVPLNNWADEANEMDWTAGNPEEEVRRICEDLKIGSKGLEKPSPLAQPGELSRTPSPSDGEPQECNKAASTPATSEGSDGEDCMDCKGDLFVVADAGMNDHTDLPTDKASLLKFMGVELMEAGDLRDLSSPLRASTSFHSNADIHYSPVQEVGEGSDKDALLPAKPCEVTVAEQETSHFAGSTSLHDIMLPLGKFTPSPVHVSNHDTDNTISDPDNPSPLANMSLDTTDGIAVNRVVSGNPIIGESPVIEEGQVAEMNTTTLTTSNNDLGSTIAANANIDGTEDGHADHTTEEPTDVLNRDPTTPTAATESVSEINPNNMSFWVAMNTITPLRRVSSVSAPPAAIKPSMRERLLLRGCPGMGKSSVSIGITPTTAPGVVQRMRESTGRRRRRSGGGAAGNNGEGASAGWRVRTQILGDGTAAWCCENAEKGQGWVKKAWKGMNTLFGREINVLSL